ncbi:acetylornithine transaminase [Oenococcus kitaharae]|uniref:Acetylornithine aminotransferase n=1 Tax=Oenococcus kitaharae DSM 17330 TaxID=1045004 RepID=G9WJD7_9LACO|nr:acetylornithine transaminase [Oenococcus kitaharae]EHN58743.1 Acetylornithine aminotransferase [Oenococcus kitaharae DSM 17330]OEY81906.1 acetylornithine aminotransferase [Oenococcus kitaharae]OEY82296.1 acetylornithine aminotransferase [Oenococcus kitaharae]OEY82522.1 acetylornithine aminotransferase [Oenococcus kitaharae]
MTHLFHTYSRFPIELVDGHDFHLTDKQGKEYVDLASGIGVMSFGYHNPAIVDAVDKQLHKIWHVSNLYESSLQEEVAGKLTQLAGSDYLAFFANSGTEANEAALKLAHKFTGRKKVMTFTDSFHGRTYGSLAVTDYPGIKSGFFVDQTSVVVAPYNDPFALHLLDDSFAAVIVEMIQGEGGVNMIDPDWLKKLADQAKACAALLIVDEVQTGIGRTAAAFAFQHYGLEPDIITSAKALGAGIPIGAMMGKKVLGSAFTPGSHGTTFGGNLLAMASANAVLSQLTDSFLKDVSQKGSFVFSLLKEKLQDLPQVQDIRGQGLMIGIQLAGTLPVASVISDLQAAGYLTLSSKHNTLRLLPPLIIDEAHLAAAVDAIASVIKKQSEVTA